MTNKVENRQAPRLFYGWVIVGVMAVTGVVSMAMGGLNFGLFIAPMGAELGAGRADFGWAQTARQGAAALTSPITGRLLDRFGARTLLPIAMALTALSVLGLSRVTHAWQLIALFGAIGFVGMIGPGSLVTSVPIAKWFVRKRGRAMSFTTVGGPLGSVVLVPVTQVLIAGVGWRATWTILGIAGAAIVIPLAVIFLRRQPEDIGLLPDGAGRLPVSAPSSASGATATADVETSWTLREVLRTATFWRLMFTFAIVTLGVSTIGLHRIPYFMDQGIEAKSVAYATGLDALASAISLLAFGFLVDRFQARYLGAIGFLIMALAMFFTLRTTSTPMMFAAMITFGFGVGGNLLLQNYLWAHYYGRRNLGEIRGVVMPITLIFGGIGAPLAGYVRDNTGSYQMVWWLGLGLVIAGALTLATSPMPKRRKDSSA